MAEQTHTESARNQADSQHLAKSDRRIADLFSTSRTCILLPTVLRPRFGGFLGGAALKASAFGGKAERPVSGEALTGRFEGTF